MDNTSRSFAQIEDQFFLLYLIMGTYFGPDLKEEQPKKSALRRMSEARPPYTSNQLAGTCIKTAEIERLYYYILREADKSAILPLPSFYQFFHGIPHTPIQGYAASYPKFSDLFPPGLHHLVRADSGYNVIENIVFVNDPDVSYITPTCLERFRKLTGLKDLVFDGDSLTDLLLPLPKTIHQAMLVLPTSPREEDWGDIVGGVKGGYVITGSAASGKVGPVLGPLDIAESEEAYLFRVSLPGVTRDEREFSCEVENDGTVVIKGVTTGGEKTVRKHSLTFEMQSQNICPPGFFSLSFKLPGPVNPHKFSGTFGTDAILEGIVLKDDPNRK